MSVNNLSNLYECVCQNQDWRGSLLRDCCVMITTRPVKEDELRVSSHAQFEINGLDSREQKEQFARKILSNEEDVKGRVT